MSTYDTMSDAEIDKRIDDAYQLGYRKGRDGAYQRGYEAALADCKVGPKEGKDATNDNRH